ncbi:MAG TPA: DUF4157 domain-containing protein, partial [Kofleriaceae bacterium]
VAQAAQPLPHLDKIQQAFGEHEVGHVKAAVGGEGGAAAGEMGARAYTAGDRVAFRDQPDLHLAAHEAAHVVQQRGGVQLKDGVGRPGDPYERQADAVADAVVGGKSAEHMLGPKQAAGGHAGVQMACSCGGSCASCSGGGGAMATPAVQMEIDPASTRVWEPLSAPGVGSAAPKVRESKSDGKAPAPSAPGGGAPSAPSGGGDRAEQKPAQKSEPEPDGGGNTGGGEEKEPDDVDDKEIDKGYADADTKADQDREATDAAARKQRERAHGLARVKGKLVRAFQAPAAREGCNDYVERKAPTSAPSTKPPATPRTEPDIDPKLLARAKAAADQFCDAPDDPLPVKDADTEEQEPCCEPVPEKPPWADDPDIFDRLSAPEEPKPGKLELHASSGPEGADQPPPAEPAAPQATGGDCKGDGKPPPPPAPPPAELPLPKPVATPVHASPSPIADTIASAEDARGRAILDADVARVSVGAPIGQLDALAAEPVHLAADASQASSSLISDTLDDGARTAQDAIHDFAAAVPVELHAALETTKDQIDTASASTRDQISGRFAAARTQAERVAQDGRDHVEVDYHATVTKLEARAKLLLGTIEQAREQTHAAMFAAQSATFQKLDQKLHAGEAAVRLIGQASGTDALAVGRAWWSKYREMRINRLDNITDGHLTDRRADARAAAAMTTAGGFRDSFINESESQASQLHASRASYCNSIMQSSVIAESALDDQSQQFHDGVVKELADSVADAGAKRAQALAQIEVQLAAQVSRLAQEEHDHRQLVDDTAYLQKLAAEQVTHRTATQVLGGAAEAGAALASALVTIRAQFDGKPAPAELPAAMAKLRGAIETAVAQFTTQARAGLARGVAAVAPPATVAREAFRKERTAAAETAAKLTRLFTDAMAEGERLVTHAFHEQVVEFYKGANSQHLAIKKAMHCALLGLKAVFAGEIAKLGGRIEGMTTALQDSFDEQIDLQLVADIRYYACKAAAREQPAWKTALKILVIIAVFVFAPEAIAFLGELMVGFGVSAGVAAIVAEVVVGALSAAANTMADNFASGQPLFHGVGTAMLVGGLTAGFARVLGGGVGLILGKGGGFARQLFVDLATAYSTQVVSTRLETGSWSFKPDIGSLIEAGAWSFAGHVYGGALHKRNAARASEPPAGERAPSVTDRALDYLSRRVARAGAAGRDLGGRARAAVRGEPVAPRGNPTAPPAPEPAARVPEHTPKPTARAPEPTVRGNEPPVFASEPIVHAAEPAPHAREPSATSSEHVARPTESTAAVATAEPAPGHASHVGEPLVTPGVVAEIRTKDGHTISILEDGRIKICSWCDDMRAKYASELTLHPELETRLRRIEQMNNSKGTQALAIEALYEKLERVRAEDAVPGGHRAEPTHGATHESKKGSATSSASNVQHERRLALEENWETRKPKDVQELVSLRKAQGEATYLPGTPEHALIARAKSSSPFKKFFNYWLEKIYLRNVRNAEGGLSREGELRGELSVEGSEATSSIEWTRRGRRQVDAKIPKRGRRPETLVQLKRTDVSLTTVRHGGQLSTVEALARDRLLVAKHKRVIWVIEGSASAAFLKAAKTAGVQVIHGAGAYDRAVKLLNPKQD